MKISRKFARRLLVPAALLLSCGTAALAAKPVPPPPDHWVGTWATASYAQDNTGGLGTADTTLREIVHTSLAGPLVRVEFTNRFGTEPLVIGAAHIALADVTGSLDLPTANALTFGGKPSVTIPAGGIVVSDPAALTLPAFSNLAVSIFLPAQHISHLSTHGGANEQNFTAAGNVVGQKTITALQTTTDWLFLRDVQVKVPDADGAVVAFGDSITNGSGSPLNGNGRWPDVLARRLAGSKKTRDLGVLNEGIGGNRVLDDGTGPNALARFDDDVLSLPGVRYLILLESINDIGHYNEGPHASSPVTADALIQGLSELAERAHTHGIQVIGATLTPYQGAKYASPGGEQIRIAVNEWIRTTKLLDGVIDFDKATRDPAKPDTFRQDFQRGDYLHPSPAGYKAMGDSIDLSLFDPNHKTKTEIHFAN